MLRQAAAPEQVCTYVKAQEHLCWLRSAEANGHELCFASDPIELPTYDFSAVAHWPLDYVTSETVKG